MDRNEFMLKRDKAASDLWAACYETMRKIDKNLVAQGIDDMILNLKEYINREKDKALGCLCKYEALSGSIGLSEDDIRKIVSLKESISSISDDCKDIEEYVINACTLASISERLVS